MVMQTQARALVQIELLEVKAGDIEIRTATLTGTGVNLQAGREAGPTGLR